MKNIAIVTGASSGIGKEFFSSLSSQAPNVEEIWVVARSADKLRALQALTNVPVRVFALDLSKTESTQTVLQALEEEKPSVEYLICASGFGKFGGVEETNREDLENMVDLNCKSIVSMTQAVAPYMKKGGVMMLVASLASFQPIPYIATYGASKAFVLSYGRAFNRELRKSRGAKCLCVCPFWTKTAFFDRAVDKEGPSVVKKYAVMYEPSQIVNQAWKDARKNSCDVSIYGWYAKGQRVLVKCLPHRLVMSVWMHQQGLK